MPRLLSLLCLALLAFAAVQLSVDGATVPSKPVSEWSNADIGTWLQSIAPLRRYQSAFVSSGLDGRMLEAMTDAQLVLFLEDDPKAFDAFVAEFKAAKAATTAAAAAAKSKATEKPVAASTVSPAVAAASVEWTEAFAKEEATALAAIETARRNAAPAAAAQPQSEQCAAVLSAEQISGVKQLQSKLAADAAAATPSTVASPIAEWTRAEQGNGCMRVLRQALQQQPEPTTLKSLAGKVVVVLGGGDAACSLRAQMRTSSLADSWAQLSVLSIGKGPAPTEGCSDLHLDVEASQGACALFHLGVRPDAIFLSDATVLQMFAESRAAAATDSLSCGCAQWASLWANSDVPIIGELVDAAAPRLLNSLAVRLFNRRVFVDAPCFAVVGAEQPGLTLTSAQGVAAASFSCNDTLGSSPIASSVPLVSAYMLVEPSKSFDKLQARVEKALESFAPHVDNLLVINLVEDNGGMEEQARMHSLLREELSNVRSLRYYKLVHWKLSSFGNSYAKLRNHALRVLAGLDPADTALAAKLPSVFVLQVAPEEVLQHAGALRSLLESSRHLCGPSQRATLLPVLTNSTTLLLEPRVFRSANALRADWDPDWLGVANENEWGYASSSSERYTNWQQERLGVALSTASAAAATAGGAEQVLLRRQVLFAPVERLIRDVGLLLAQEAELEAKMAWWAERYAPSSENQFAPPPPLPLRWTALLGHTHFALASAYLKNKQVPEAYDFFMQRVEAILPTPLDANFSAAVAAAAAAGGAPTPAWNQVQVCFSLFQLATLRPQLLDAELDDSLRAALARASDARIDLGAYFGQALEQRCADSTVEAAFLHLDSLAAAKSWTDAAAYVERRGLRALVAPAAKQPHRHCTIDPSVCTGKLAALLRKVDSNQPKTAGK